MTHYQTYLLLESLSYVFSAEELLDGRDIIKLLCNAFNLRQASANCLVDGALTLKKLRESRVTSEEPIYVQ